MLKAQSGRLLLQLSVLTILMTLPSASGFKEDYHSSQSIPVQAAPVAPAVPSLLTASDLSLYQQAFSLQRAGKVEEAAAQLAHVGNPLLKDVVSQLAALAPAAGAGKGSLVSNGYTRSTLADNAGWKAALLAYKHGGLSVAATSFARLADEKSKLPPDDRAAASFWAYRAYLALGKIGLAQRYLQQTAAQPLSFYNLIATSLLQGDTSPDAYNKVSPEQVELACQKLEVQRAAALKELGEEALAETELRQLYLRANGEERRVLLAVAEKLNLPAIQMRMATTSVGRGKEAFPLPDWQPASGYQVERALLFAFMRQESGFNPHARSAQGAVGLMQLMPATVHAMSKDGLGSTGSADPAVNIALGQRYLEHLMETPHIGDNLIYLTAAYNAGPAMVANWLKSMPQTQAQDPLLFVETMPYAQTREYVRHVITNYWIYSQILGVEKPASLQALARGHWPRYEGAERQLVALLSRQ